MRCGVNAFGRFVLVGLLFWLALMTLIVMRLDTYKQSSKGLHRYWDWVANRGLLLVGAPNGNNSSVSQAKKRGGLGDHVVKPKGCPKDSPLITQLRHIKRRLIEERANRTEEMTAAEQELLAQKFPGKKLIHMFHKNTWNGLGHTGKVDWAGLWMTKTYPDDCKFSIAGDQSLIKRADLILYDLFSFLFHKGDKNATSYCHRPFPFPDNKPSYQKWGIYHYEQYKQFPGIAEAELMEMFDVHLNYSRAATIPVSFTCPWTGSWDDYYTTPADVERVLSHDPASPHPPPKIERKLVAYFGSRCTPNRELYIQALMKIVPVHSYGKCMNNANMTEEKPNAVPRNWALKIKELRKFKFTLAFENGIVDDYITEKLAQAIMAGTVPVFKGSEDIDGQLPGPHSIIKTSDFNSPEQLAHYLLELDRDDRRYAEYFAWKKHGPSPEYRKKMDECIFFAETRICRAVGAKGSVNVTVKAL